MEQTDEHPAISAPATEWKTIEHLYHAGIRPRIVEVPPLTTLSISGFGAPREIPFVEVIEALMSVSYSAQFQTGDREHGTWKVPPPEALIWPAKSTSDNNGDIREQQCRWKLFIVQPDDLDKGGLRAAQKHAAAKRGETPFWKRIRLDSINEGTCVQVMHIGPHEHEGPTLTRLKEFVAVRGLDVHGKHHEIYLGDPRRNNPAQVKTIIRLPVKPSRH